MGDQKEKWERWTFIFPSGNVIPFTKKPGMGLKRVGETWQLTKKNNEGRSELIAEFCAPELVIRNQDEFDDMILGQVGELTANDQKKIADAVNLIGKWVHQYGGVSPIAKKIQDLLAERFPEYAPEKTRGGLSRAMATNQKVKKKKEASSDGQAKE